MIAETLRSHLSPDQSACIESLVLETLGEPPKTTTPDSLAGWLVSETQRAWLRPPGKERWQVEATRECDEKLVRILEDSPFQAERLPRTACADHVLLMSAIESEFLVRLEYFSVLVREGFVPNAVYLLGGQRVLDPDRECEIRGVLGQEAREIDMLEFHAEQARNRHPWLEGLEFVSCSTPYQEDASGNLRRPNTHDTIVTWLQEHFDGGSVLCLSNQPFVDYQTTLFRKLLPKEVVIDGAGARADRCSPSIVLDAIARMLYTLFS